MMLKGGVARIAFQIGSVANIIFKSERSPAALSQVAI
jgi:hypothetical protein